MLQDFQPADTPVLRELRPEGIQYGPVGYGAEDLEVERYAMFYRDVHLLFAHKGKEDCIRSHLFKHTRECLSYDEAERPIETSDK